MAGITTASDPTTSRARHIAIKGSAGSMVAGTTIGERRLARMQ